MSCSTILGSAILPSKILLFLSFQRFHALSSPQLWLLGYSFTPPFLVSSIGSAETDTTPPNQLLTSPQTSTGNGQRFSVVSPQPPPSPIPLNPLFSGVTTLAWGGSHLILSLRNECGFMHLYMKLDDLMLLPLDRSVPLSSLAKLAFLLN